MKVLKGVLKRENKIFFRVCLRFYDEPSIKKIFGKGEKKGNYIFFEGDFKEKEVYEKFNDLLEVTV